MRCRAGLEQGNRPHHHYPDYRMRGRTTSAGAQKKAPSRGPEVVNLQSGGCQTLNEEPHPQDAVALGLLNTNPRPMISSLKSTVTPPR